MKELFVREYEDKKQIFLIEDNKLTEFYEEDINNEIIDGNIYVGKVENILKGLDAAFINVGEGKNAFIHKKDLLPKVDETINKEENNTPISKIVKVGDPIIVQVKRDKMQSKGARVSTHISLRGKLLVLMPNTPYITVSSKILDKAKKQELKNKLQEMLPDGIGAIVRTNAAYATNEQIEDDLKNLLNRWNKIKNINIDEVPKKIYNVGGILGKVIIDLSEYGLDKIVVQNENIKIRIEELLYEVAGNVNIEVTDKKFEEFYNISRELEKMNNRKIWLDSGGFITIDNTEALTAIDVNTGKFTGKKDVEETIFKVNKEASIEIAKQLRLRDIGGIVIIDFIDMKSEEDMKKIVDILNEERLKDRSKVQILGFTKLNLLELTRKHICVH